MVRKSLHETTFPKVKKYMSESDRALTAKDVAQFLEMSTSGANSVLQLMEVFKMVQKVKRGRTYYILKDVYDDEQISAMLPPKKVKVARTPKPRRARTPKRRRPSSRQPPPPADDIFMEEYISTVRSSSGEGLSALSMIGLSQQEGDTPTKELPRELNVDYLDNLGMDIEVEDRKIGAQIRKEAFATVKHLPKDVRLLTRGETRYLKEQLKALDGYEEIKSLNTAFAKFSALEYGRYGNVLYLSMGTNQWEYVKKVTIDRCRVCGRIITEKQYIEEQECGSGGCCLCEFSDGNGTLNEMVEAKWWELLDWNQMENTWGKLSDEIKNKIRRAALAPTYDVQSLAHEDEKLPRPQGDKTTWKRYPNSPWGDIEICEHGCIREYGSTEKVCVHCDYPADANIVLSRCAVCGSTTWHLDGECMRCVEQEASER